MTYVPDPTSVTTPVPSTTSAGTAAIEFQTLKLYLASVLTAGDRRNLLINAAFNIDQQEQGGAAYTITGTGMGGYVVDQWLILNGGTGTITAQQESGGANTYSKCLQYVHDASTTSSFLTQPVESIFCSNLTTGTVLTVSGYLYVDSTSGLTIYPNLTTSGAQDNYTTSSNVGTGSNIVMTAGAFVYFKEQITLTGPATNGISLVLAAYGTAGRTIKVSNMQLEVNSFATPFEVLNPAVDLALCQRYFYVAAYWSSSYCSASGQVPVGIVNLPFTMRTATPTISILNANYISNSSTAAAVVGTVNNTTAIVCSFTSTGAGMCSAAFLVTANSRIN